MATVPRVSRQVSTNAIPGARRTAAETETSLGVGVQQAKMREAAAIAGVGEQLGELGPRGRRVRRAREGPGRRDRAHRRRQRALGLGRRARSTTRRPARSRARAKTPWASPRRPRRPSRRPPTRSRRSCSLVGSRSDSRSCASDAAAAARHHGAPAHLVGDATLRGQRAAGLRRAQAQPGHGGGRAARAGRGVSVGGDRRTDDPGPPARAHAVAGRGADGEDQERHLRRRDRPAAREGRHDGSAGLLRGAQERDHRARPGAHHQGREGGHHPREGAGRDRAHPERAP